MSEIESLLEDARKRLVETGTRNRLIHVNRGAKRGNFLNIVNERTEDIFRLLRTNGKKMRFAGKGREEDEEESKEVVLDGMEEAEVDSGNYVDSILETPLTPDALQKRLLKLARDAKTAEEEQGINILFLAMGFLRWYEDRNSEVLRESPLVLLPVELVRNDRTSTYELRCRDDDPVTNLPLQERMRTDFGIAIPNLEDAGDDWAPSNYFASIRESISHQERWSLDPDGMQLGFFSFAKLVMLRDLDPDNWEGGGLTESALLGGLLLEGFAPEPSLFREDDRLDEKLPPEKLLHVIDADSSQTKVIEEVRAGRNLVVQGPPGTGKSQTITNILATAAHDGKKVLFVAEKMAALEVVYNRMCKVGLKALCLELHSKSANKRKFLQELAATLSQGREANTPVQDVTELRRARDQLNQLSSLLHSPVPERDYTPFQVLSRLTKFIGENTPVPEFDASHLEQLNKEQEENLFDNLAAYTKIVEAGGAGGNHPFRGTQNLELQPTDIQRLGNELRTALEQLAAWSAYQEKLERRLAAAPVASLASAEKCRIAYQQLRQAPEETLRYLNLMHRNTGSPRFGEALAVAAAWTEHREKLSETVLDGVWEQDLTRLRGRLLQGVNSWLSRLIGGYRSASNELATWLSKGLPEAPAERLKLLDEIIEGGAKKKAFEDESGYLKKLLEEHWRGARTPFHVLLQVQLWLDELVENLPDPAPEKVAELLGDDAVKSFDAEHFVRRREALLSAVKQVADRLELEDLADASILPNMPLADLRSRLQEILDGSGQYGGWTKYQRARRKLLEASLDKLLQRFDQGRLALAELDTELRYALYEARWKKARELRPALDRLAAINRHALVQSFVSLEKGRAAEVQELIREKHLQQLPQGAAGEMGLIRGEIAKKRNHRPIRRMMQGASGMIQRIKPVFLMSPISVAQYLPPGKLNFDLLVIDEASQVRPEDALGSIARCKQLVVVGDQKQLPPTSFFDRLTGNLPDEDEETTDAPRAARATEMESILSLCEARGLNQSMLEWHYRSRDPSLIMVSNREFYRKRLILPPSPTQTDDSIGFRFARVSGIYSSRTRGGGRPTTNRIEAEAVADRLAELATSMPGFSIGVVTFSKAQADMMTEVLEFRRRENPVLDELLKENKHENLFVKNIENVQGDERDIILVSVGYGPHEPDGRLVSMSFGPVNAEGGERRLNVLFSRARIICEVFASFDPEEINTARTSREGPVILRKFLLYAKNRELPETYESVGDADSPFEEDVASVMRGFGYEVEHQVGASGFKIDLAARNPDNPSRYLLAVECDGATYHSALWARERDRLRQEVLEGFGWRFHRIWSTDWFHLREQEVKKLEAALLNARNQGLTTNMQGSNSGEQAAPVVPETKFELGSVPSPDPKIQVPKYRKSNLLLPSDYEPHERPVSQVIEAVCEIVSVEGPVHVDEIARRYAGAHGKTRRGARIIEHVELGLSLAAQDGKLMNKGDFWGTREQYERVPVRDRSDETSATADMENISPEEIIACAELVEKDSGSVDDDEMTRVIARTLGFQQTGSKIQAAIGRALANRGK